MTDRALEIRNSASRRALGAGLPLAVLAAVLATGEARAQNAPAPNPPASTPPASAAAKPAPAAAPTPAGSAAQASATPSSDDSAPPEPASAAPGAEPEKTTPPAPPAPALVFAARPPGPKTAPAQAEEAPEATPDDGEMGSHRDHWLATMAVRVGYISHEGLDPFDTNDVLPQFSLGAGRTVYGDGPLSLATLLLWDVGGTDATARGDESSLTVHRLTLGAEGRYHFFRRLYGFGRIAPGAVRWDASLEDDSVGYTREAGNWMFALDLSAGATFEFAGENRGKSRHPRGWLSVEGGYGWTTASEVSFVSGDENQAPARVEPLAFNDLALRGGFFRIAANLTY